MMATGSFGMGARSLGRAPPETSGYLGAAARGHDDTGRIYASGTLGKVTIGGNVSIAGSRLSFADDRTGIFSDATIGPIKIGGDVLGGNGFTAKISAERLAAPTSARRNAPLHDRCFASPVVTV